MVVWEVVIASRKLLFHVTSATDIFYFNVDTAYAQNIENQCWYDFDDSHVRKITEKDIKVR